MLYVRMYFALKGKIHAHSNTAMNSGKYNVHLQSKCTLRMRENSRQLPVLRSSKLGLALPAIRAGFAGMNGPKQVLRSSKLGLALPAIRAGFAG